MMRGATSAAIQTTNSSCHMLPAVVLSNPTRACQTQTSRIQVGVLACCARLRIAAESNCSRVKAAENPGLFV